MKKYLLTIAILSIVPSIAFASWWNPLDWFGSSDTKNQQPIQQIINPENPTTTSQQQSSTTESSLPVVSLSSTTNTLPVQTNSSSANNESKLNAQISSLTAQNNLLKSNLTATQNQLALTQKNYAMCQANLTTAQNSIVSMQQDQNKQSEPTPVVSTSKPVSAVISLDQNTPPTASLPATNGQYSSLPVLKFGIQSSSDNQVINSLTVNISASGKGNVNTASLYSTYSIPPTVVATAVVTNGSATFSNTPNTPSLNAYSYGPHNTFIIKVDVSGLTDVGSAESISASVSSAKIIDSSSHDVDVTGTAQGNIITVTNNPITIDSNGGLTSTQLDWLNQRNIRTTDVMSDSVGKYVLVTSSLNGSQTKLYLPQ